MTDGNQPNDLKLVGKCLYFVKTDPHTKVNKASGGKDDLSILFGELSENTI